uniref:Putative regulatory protein n=1 Tax=Actinomadura melliaura TaxID=360723 RepID=Q0H2W0_9ACTN|nr:putative regulatory protein [Actinomadura melliaura]
MYHPAHASNQHDDSRSREHPLHGRFAHLAHATELLHRRSGILLLEGPPGIGKSRLLAEVRHLALEQAFNVSHVTADPVLRLMPMAPLLSLVDPSPHGRAATRDPLPSASDPHGKVIQYVGARLEERAAQAPTLIILDDLHWADSATLLAVRLLPARLAGSSIVWVFAKTSGKGDQSHDHLYDLLEDGLRATRRTLPPLSESEMAQVVKDRLSATPDRHLKALVANADGNPSLVVELLEGLVEEGKIQTVKGVARLVSLGRTALPERFRTLINKRLADLSTSARQALDIAAVLGPTCSLDDVAEMLSTKAASLVPEFQEAMEARLLTSRSDEIAFVHEGIWQTVWESVPSAVRAALHRQAAEMLTAKGSSLVEVATHLIHGAQPSDAEAAEVLCRAAEEAVTVDPKRAAELAVRGLEVAEAGTGYRLSLACNAVRAMALVGPLDRAVELAERELEGARGQGESIPLRLWLAAALLLRGQAGRARELAEELLAHAHLPPEVRDTLQNTRLLAIAEESSSAAARSATEMTTRQPVRSPGRVVGLTILARERWQKGRLTEGLRLAREATDLLERDERVPWYVTPQTTLTTMLVVLGSYDEASSLVERLRDDLSVKGAQVLAGLSRMLEALIHLGVGRPDKAASEAQAGLEASADAGSPQLTWLAWLVLATLALRRGDLAAAAEHTAQAESVPGIPLPVLLWLKGQLAAAEGDLPRAMEVLTPLYEDLELRTHLLSNSRIAAAWLARTALAAGLPHRAVAVTSTAERIAADNPELSSMLTAAAHARGILDGDTQMLDHAVKEHTDPWERASAAEDLAAALADTDREAAVYWLENALVGYEAVQAGRDSARVRLRLRDMGVRRRHWSYAKRPATGWESLTKTEWAVATFVAQGLTNKQVAKRMFLSPHTVGFHLRQIFRKLEIRSRVELARLGQERAVI